MRLVGRQVEQQGDGADQVVAVEGAENDSLAPIGRGERPCQNASAVSGASGCMKLTEPPLATVSIEDLAQRLQDIGRGLKGLD